MSLAAITLPTVLAAAGNPFLNFLNDGVPTRYPTKQPTNNPTKSPRFETNVYDINPLAGVSVVFRPNLEFWFAGDDAPLFTVHNPRHWVSSGWLRDTITNKGRGSLAPEKVQYWPKPLWEHLMLKCAGWTEKQAGADIKFIYLYGKARYLGLPNDPQMYYDYYKVTKDGHEAIFIEVDGNATNMGKHGTLNLRIQEKVMNPEGYYQMVWMDGAPIVWQNNQLKTQTVQVQYGFSVFRFKSTVAERRIKVPDQPDIVVPYTHLDVTMDQPRGADQMCKDGIVAELYGSKPMSDKVTAMLRPPKVGDARHPGKGTGEMVLQDPEMPTPGMWPAIRTRDWKAEALAAEKLRQENAQERKAEDARIAKILKENQMKVAKAMVDGLLPHERALHKAHMAETERLRKEEEEAAKAKRQKARQESNAAVHLHNSVQKILKDRTAELTKDQSGPLINP